MNKEIFKIIGLFCLTIGAFVLQYKMDQIEKSHKKYLVSCPNQESILSQNAHISQYGEMWYEDAQGDRKSLASTCIIKAQDDRLPLLEKDSSFPYSSLWSCNQECLDKGLDQKKKDEKDSDDTFFLLMMMSQ